MSEDPNLRHICFDGASARPVRPPRAVGATARILRPAGMAVHQPFAEPRAGASPDVDLARWMLRRAGLDPFAYRAESLRRRVPACLRALKVRSEHEARQRIAEHPERIVAAVSSLLIGVTSFFRDRDVFDALRSSVLPTLALGPGPLRAWSAGCATGNELYSFAALLAAAGLLDGATLLGTDCRPDAIGKAAHGVFPAAVLRDGGEPVLESGFEPAGDTGLRPIARWRRGIRWKVADVLKAAEPGPWDVIFWRNTAIYLEPVPIALVYTRLVAELSAGGFLVVGKAERPPASAGLAPVSRCIYQKRGA